MNLDTLTHMFVKGYVEGGVCGSFVEGQNFPPFPFHQKAQKIFLKREERGDITLPFSWEDFLADVFHTGFRLGVEERRRDVFLENPIRVAITEEDKMYSVKVHLTQKGEKKKRKVGERKESGKVTVM